MSSKLKILFLCTGNSCRSQMAEGWARHLHGDKYEVYSAGITTHGVNSSAVNVMLESGVDISDHTSNNINEYRDINFDFVITVCGHADENCPVFSDRTKKIHKGFPDPPKLTSNIKDPKEKLVIFREVRDEIKKFINELPSLLII